MSKIAEAPSPLSSAITHYFTARNGDGFWLRAGSPTFEAYDPDHWALYMFAATDIGAGNYRAILPDEVDTFDLRAVLSSSGAPTDQAVAVGDFDDGDENGSGDGIVNNVMSSLLKIVESGTKTTDVDGTVTEKNTINELIAADRYIRERAAADAAAANPSRSPFRTFKLVPPGANGV